MAIRVAEKYGVKRVCAPFVVDHARPPFQGDDTGHFSRVRLAGFHDYVPLGRWRRFRCLHVHTDCSIATSVFSLK